MHVHGGSLVLERFLLLARLSCPRLPGVRLGDRRDSDDLREPYDRDRADLLSKQWAVSHSGNLIYNGRSSDLPLRVLMSLVALAAGRSFQR